MRKMARFLLCLLMSLNGFPPVQAHASKSCEKIWFDDIRPMDEAEATQLILRSTSLLAIDESDAWKRKFHEVFDTEHAHRLHRLNVTLLGAANSGKSTFFNVLPSVFEGSEGQFSNFQVVNRSSMDFTAGTTARPVILSSSEVPVDVVMKDLGIFKFDRWREVSQTQESGLPLGLSEFPFYEHLSVVDTPPLEMQGNREATHNVLAESDVIFYIVEPSTYRSDNQIDLLKNYFSRLGRKKFILIYRTGEFTPAPIVDQHLAELGHRIVGDESSRWLVGAYQMVVHRSALNGQAEKVDLFPRLDSKPLGSLLQELDQNAMQIRESLDHESRQAFLREIDKSVKRHMRWKAELNFTRTLVDKYVENLTRESIEGLPYDRIASELEEIWYSRSQGFRSVSRWLARPLAMMRGLGTEVRIDGPGYRELSKALNNVIDQVVARLQLAAARKIIRLPLGSPSQVELSTQLGNLRQEFKLNANEPPFERANGDYAEYELPASAQVRQYLAKVANGDWAALAKPIQTDVQENLANLTIQAQAHLSTLVKQQGMPRRMLGHFYTFASILPMTAAFAYMLRTGNFTDLTAVSGVLGSALLAKLFVHLDERNLKIGWTEAVSEWYGERQQPRLIEILKQNFDIPDPAQQAPKTSDLHMLEYAIRTLQQKP